MALVAAEQYEPFLKKNVIGNILDQVDGYQYNLKLYMIPPVASPVGAQPSSVKTSHQMLRMQAAKAATYKIHL